MNKLYLVRVVIVIAVFGFLAMYHSEPLRCPDEYATYEKSLAAFERWTKEFYGQNPEATLEEYGQARRDFYEDHGCTEALKRQDDYYAGNADPETVEAVDKAVNEALNDPYR